LNSTETDDEANEEEIDDFLDEALSDPEDRKQPQIKPVSLAKLNDYYHKFFYLCSVTNT
jgi:hypothetical protein